MQFLQEIQGIQALRVPAFLFFQPVLMLVEAPSWHVFVELDHFSDFLG